MFRISVQTTLQTKQNLAKNKKKLPPFETIGRA